MAGTMSHVRNCFTMPPGPPARVIVWLPGTRGLQKHAEQMGLRSLVTSTHAAISLALITFGEHPDAHHALRTKLVDVFGGLARYSDEKVQDRITRFGAPKQVKTAAGLVQWFLEERFLQPDFVPLPLGWLDDEFSDKDDDKDKKKNDNMSKSDVETDDVETKSDTDESNTKKPFHPSKRQRMSKSDVKTDDAKTGDVKTGDVKTDDVETSSDTDESDTSKPFHSSKRQRIV